MREDRSKLVYSTGPKEKTAGKEQKPETKAPPADKAAAGRAQKLHLRLERKGRGGKTVTLVCGLAMPRAGMESLLKDMKARLGTGGALKDNTLELQGDHREAITAMLRDKGLPV